MPSVNIYEYMGETSTESTQTSLLPILKLTTFFERFEHFELGVISTSCTVLSSTAIYLVLTLISTS